MHAVEKSVKRIQTDACARVMSAPARNRGLWNHVEQEQVGATAKASPPREIGHQWERHDIPMGRNPESVKEESISSNGRSTGP